MDVKLDDFIRDFHQNGHIPEHVRAFSGRSTLGKRDGSVTGVSRFYAPPFTAEKFSFELNFDVRSHGVVIGDSAAVGWEAPVQFKLIEEKWHPSYILRKGIFHDYYNGKALDLAIQTCAVPSAVDDAFYLDMTVENLSVVEVEFDAYPCWRENKFGDATGKEWAWLAPWVDEPAKKECDGLYEGENAYMSLVWSTNDGVGEKTSVKLTRGESKRFVLKVSFGDKANVCKSVDVIDEVEKTLSIREEKWNGFYESVPHFHSSCERLDKAYLHSLLNLFLIKWESPHFILSPFYAEAGLCGNATCSYTWGVAYISKMMMLVGGQSFKLNILAHLSMGLDEHYAVDPITGKGLGPCYNYNLISVITLVRDYVALTGDEGFLSQEVNGVPLYRLLVNLVESIESGLNKYGQLLDYGDHHNLLEMRGSGYEHIVPSPNGERVVIYRYLAEVLERFGFHDEAQKYIEKASAVKKDLTERLWDEKNGWLKCAYPDGREELVYSIQIFDLLGIDLLSPEQEKAIVAHINEREFLSTYGVNSVSKTDYFHYELGDVDWSGAGAYIGDPCNLMEVLFSMGDTQKAWDVTQRLLWWSDEYPYWPQAIWVNKKDYSHWETPINKSAVAFAQAVLFGIMGMKVENGDVKFEPNVPEQLKFAEVTNVKLFGKEYSFRK